MICHCIIKYEKQLNPNQLHYARSQVCFTPPWSPTHPTLEF